MKKHLQFNKQYNMKIIYTIGLMLLLSNYIFAQYVNVPNSALMGEFTEYGYDSNGDGKLTYTEAALVKKVIVKGYNMSDFTGLEAFVNLEYLDISGNALTTYNFGVFPKLNYLNVDYNSLASLDLSNNKLLDTLICSRNQLKSLNIDSLLELKYLHMYDNQISSINVINNSKIEYFNCSKNSLTQLDLSNLKLLDDLNASYNQITNIEFAENNLGRKIFIYDNKLTTIDTKSGSNLLFLDCNSNNLLSLDIRKYTNLLYLNTNINQNLSQICVTDSSNANQKGFRKETYTTWAINCETGINENEFVNKPIFYPNPAKYEFTISVNIENASILDLTGKAIITFSNNKFYINNIKPGVYILEIKDLIGHISREKLIIEN